MLHKGMGLLDYGIGEYGMQNIAPEVISIADACLGGLRGRSALLVGPEEQRYPYMMLLNSMRMKYVYEEDTSARIPYILPHVQLMISLPAPYGLTGQTAPLLSAARIAKGCDGRHTPLLIFDLAPYPHASVEELAGLLPAVCLYTPADLRSILAKEMAKAS
jgi:hypothetical protein